MNITDDTKDAAWDAVAEARDRYNRAPDDAPTGEIVEELARKGLLKEVE